MERSQCSLKCHQRSPGLLNEMRERLGRRRVGVAGDVGDGDNDEGDESEDDDVGDDDGDSSR